jgi:hypothetical protein
VNDCTCNQHGDYCPEHPNCACGCPKHAHDSAGCVAGSMNCHGCDVYRPAKTTRFHELDDDALEQITSVESLRLEYKVFRAHHIEETTALYHKLLLARMQRS